jgi:hypothetical protein
MASSLERTSSSGSVPIQRNEENIQVLLPDATAPAWEEVLTGVNQGTIPTVLIELGLIFINGARVLPRDIPAWLGHEATDIPSEAENEDKTVEEAKSWTEIVLEDDGTVAITVPFNTSVCCKEVFISHPALDKHMSVAHNDTNAPCVRRPLQGINKQQYTMGSAKRKTVERRSLQGQRTHKREP